MKFHALPCSKVMKKLFKKSIIYECSKIPKKNSRYSWVVKFDFLDPVHFLDFTTFNVDNCILYGCLFPKIGIYNSSL